MRAWYVEINFVTDHPHWIMTAPRNKFEGIYLVKLYTDEVRVCVKKNISENTHAKSPFLAWYQFRNLYYIKCMACKTISGFF